MTSPRRVRYTTGSRPSPIGCASLTLTPLGEVASTMVPGGAAAGTSVVTSHARCSGSAKSGFDVVSVALVIGEAAEPSTSTAIDTPSGTTISGGGGDSCHRFAAL